MIDEVGCHHQEILPCEETPDFIFGLCLGCSDGTFVLWDRGFFRRFEGQPNPAERGTNAEKANTGRQTHRMRVDVRRFKAAIASIAVLKGVLPWWRNR